MKKMSSFVLMFFATAIHVMDHLEIVGSADVSSKLINNMLKTYQPLFRAPVVGRDGVLMPNYHEETLKMVLPNFVNQSPKQLTIDGEHTRDELFSAITNLMSVDSSMAREPDVDDHLGSIREVDNAEERANLELVNGINLMARQNETIDSVVDDVLNEHHS